VLLMAVVVLTVMAVLGTVFVSLLSSATESRIAQFRGDRAFYMAEAGGRYAMYRLLKLGPDHVPELDGQTFRLSDRTGFTLGVSYDDEAKIYAISSTGFVEDGGGVRKERLTRYDVDALAGSQSEEVVFRFAVLLTGDTSTKITGSAYIDSYDSDVAPWSSPGGYEDGAFIFSPISDDTALVLSGSGKLYGTVSVPDGTDIADYDLFITVPNWYSSDLYPGLTTGDGTLPTAPAWTEADEASMPVSWDPAPSLSDSPTETIAGGSYYTNKDFSLGSNKVLTFYSSTDLDVGTDLSLSGSSSLSVDGDFSAWIERDFEIGGGGSGVDVSGNADLQVGRNFEISSGLTFVVDGDLDLDVAGDFKLTGDSTLYVKGNASIDVAGDFSISGSSKLIVEGETTIRAGEGVSFTGYEYPLIIRDEGSVQMFVDSGKITISSATINEGYTADRFMIFAGEDVSTVAINGSGYVVAAIYAPYSTFSINGSSQLFGAVVAQALKSLGGSVAIHYDQALGRWHAGTGTGSGTGPGSGTGSAEAVQRLRAYWVSGT
jgi:hypothetical protein